MILLDIARPPANYNMTIPYGTPLEPEDQPPLTFSELAKAPMIAQYKLST